MKSRPAGAFVVAALLLGLPAFGEEGAPVATSALVTMNQTFRKHYAFAKRELEKHQGPVIYISGETVTFRAGGVRQEHSYVPPNWHTLKAVDHLPLAIYVMLWNSTDTKLDADLIGRLKEMRDCAVAAAPTIGSYGLSSSALARQKEMFEGGTGFLDSVIEKGLVSKASLNEYCRKSTPALMANADEAVEMELSSLDKLVQDWRKTISPADWKRTKAVISGGHMPRQKERTTAYFLRLFGQKQEGDRVIYQEGGEKSGMLDLLVTHELDAHVGEAFFHDYWRMHRDLLSDSAVKYLKKHPPLR